MSNSYPPQPPYPQQPPFPPQPPYRRLERSQDDRVFAGVCGGVAEYANLDPALVRVLTVAATLFTGVPLIAYLLALFLMPEAGSTGRSPAFPPAPGSVAGYPPYPGSRPDSSPRQYDGGATQEDQAVWGPAGPPWQQGPAGPQHRTSPRQYGTQDPDSRS